MARIRTIKPEFWDDEKLARASRDARLTFIGMWTHSDDYGVVKGHVSWLKNNIFPYDDISPETFRTWLDELTAFGFIVPFDANGEAYFLIKNFKKHQVINRASKCARNPSPPDDINDNPRPIHRAITESSVSPHGALSEPSVSHHGALTEHSPEEGKGREGKGSKDKRGLAPSLVPDSAVGDPCTKVQPQVPTSQPDVPNVANVAGNVQRQPTKPDRHPLCPYQDIIAAYHDAMPANPRIRQLDDTSRKNLQTRWRESPERQGLDWWREFFAWCAKSQFLTGRKNDFIADLMWLVRPMNFAKVLSGRYHHESPNGQLPPRTRQNMAAADEVKRMIREGKL